MQHRFAFVLVTVLFAACASGGGAPEAAGPRLGDPALYTILAEVPLSTAADSALLVYELEHPRDFLDQVAVVAEDPRAGLNPRYNAVRLLGERGSAAHLSALRLAATDRDPRVRSAVVVAAAQIAETGGAGRELVRAALSDPAPAVVAKALEYMDARDLEVLRGFVATQRDAELRRIASEVIRTEEERGAPLAADSAGVLRRTVTPEVGLTFRPERSWPDWDAAVGRVTINAARGPVQLEGIEVVRGVVPVFFSPEARYAVYEQGRRIFVRDLEQGTVREVGAGVAPRPLPFTADFVFLREAPGGRAEVRDRTRLRYEVVRASFTGGGEPVVLGTATASAQHTESGNYSPVRWLRVVSRGESFALEAAGLDTFLLPAVFPGSRP